jgi:acyl-CoA thioester hydrolase
MSDKDFNTVLKLRIDWSELDLFGHVNNVQFFKFIQSARVNYWELIGLYKMLMEEKIGPLLASAECQFKKPLYYPGEIKINTRLNFIKNTSFGLEYRLLNDAGDIVAEAHDVMVLWDFNQDVKCIIPDKLRDAIWEIEY